MNYFISDTHFGHQKVIQFERHRFKTILDHDNYIMRRLEAQHFSPEDTLYHLGDFGFGLNNYEFDSKKHIPELLDRWRKLPCQKVLILGNHDREPQLSGLDLFDEIHTTPMFLTKRILLSHEPEAVSPYVLNVHGHLHGSYLDSINHLNVSIHMIDYTPISEKKIDRMLAKLPIRNHNFLSEWYCPLYIYTEPSDDKVLTPDGHIDYEATVKLLKDHYLVKTLADDKTTVEVKRFATREDKSVYRDRNDKYYLATWDPEARKEIIVPAKILELPSASIHQRWNRCWINGKIWSKVFPEATNEEKYIFLDVISNEEELYL